MSDLYFICGLFSTFGLNRFLSHLTDVLWSSVVSIIGGVLSAVVVAWLKKQWKQRERKD